MFKVALLRAFSQYNYEEPGEPLGIEALAAILRKNNIECRLFDREKDSLDDVTKAIVEYGPSLLGLSVLLEDNCFDALKVLLKVRRKLSVPCVVGGLFVTTDFEKARSLFPGDCKLVRGEGETEILKICSSLTGEEYPDMEKAFLNPNEWPWLYRPDLQYYLDKGAPISMKSSRGCPGQCSFCITPLLPNGLNKWCGRKISDVADEMAHLCRHYNPPAFNFIDDDFGPLSRLIELTDELKKRNAHCAISLQLRASDIYSIPDYEEIFRRLKGRGVYFVFIGIESLNEETLKYFNKNLNPIKALEAIKTICRAGISVNMGYILWHPLSTVESIKTEAVMLREAGLFTAKTCVSRMGLFPGSKLFEETDKDAYSLSMTDFFEKIKNANEPLYDAWLVSALKLPRYYAAAYLYPSDKYTSAIFEIEKELDRVNELSFRLLTDYDNVKTSEIEETAADVKERFAELGSTFVRDR
jgi:radical SAM superfamily enzyme YgiQ (UPF0313 family)